MIKVEKVEAWGIVHAIRGMRNPMNSWDKSDSRYANQLDAKTIQNMKEREFILGENDLDLMKRLYKAGTEHRKYLRQIFVSMDITAPLYWWKEFDTYKIGTTANSCSTMHKIHAKEFELDDFSHEHLLDADEGELYAVLIDGELCIYSSEGFLNHTCKMLNHFRTRYLETKDKKYWWQMIQLLPSSYNQKRTVTMNYENVMSIINQRSNHKLDEWHIFIAELERLPYVKEIRDGE